MEKTIKSAVVTIGDELLIGQVGDTNSAFIAERFNQLGIELTSTISIHDDRRQILDVINQTLDEVDILVLTGGLGPTKDDITKNTLSEYFGSQLVEDETVRQHILTLYADRPEVLNRLTETQWQVPDNATILENRVGSAPLMLWDIQRDGRRKIVVSLPGVPYEMMIAIDEQIVPYLKSHYLERSAHIIHRNVLVFGVPESTLALKIERWEDALPASMHLAYLPKDGIVRLRLSTYGQATEQQMDEQIEKLLPLISDHVIATEDKPLEVLVGEQLRRLHATVSTAESCTGGKIASLLNRHSGSSDFYKGSIVAYSNEVKENVLHVRRDYLEQFGAVSEQVVTLMAYGATRVLNTDYAIATSGVAGPTGGTPDKPVGTVWIAVATPEKVYTRLLRLGKLREQNTDRATVQALVMLLRLLRQA